MVKGVKTEMKQTEQDEMRRRMIDMTNQMEKMKQNYVVWHNKITEKNKYVEYKDGEDKKEVSTLWGDDG
jgi:hypothetical protein